RAPCTSRLSTSRPRSSVPSTCCHVPPENTGGSRALAKSTCSGSWGARNGPRIPVRTNSVRIVPENSGRRRSLRSRPRRAPEGTDGSAVVSSWASAPPASASKVSRAGSEGTALPPHSWVEQSVRDVDDEQQSDEDQRIDEHDALDDVVVARVHGLDGEV